MKLLPCLLVCISLIGCSSAAKNANKRGPDTTAPVISVHFPSENANGIAPPVNISIRFSEAIITDNIANSILVYLNPSSLPRELITGTFSELSSNNEIIFTPDVAFNYNSIYEIEISTSLTDLANNNLIGNDGAVYRWTFTTGPEPILPSFINSVTPNVNAANVPLNQTIRIDFKFSMLDANIDDTNLLLSTLAGKPIAASVQYIEDGDGFRVLLTPHLPVAKTGLAQIDSLVHGTPYQVKLDLSNHPALSTTFAWGFTTKIGAWQANATQLDSSDLGDASTPKLFAYRDGDIRAFWFQHDNVPRITSLWSIGYSMINGWDKQANIIDPFIVDSGTTHIGGAEYAMDDDGNILVVWQQSDGNIITGSVNSIYARRYTKGSGWEDEVEIDSSALNSLWPSLHMHPDGNAVVVWVEKQTDDVNYLIKSNVFDPSTGWHMNKSSVITAIPINSPYTTYVGELQVKTDAGQNAIAIWTQNGNVMRNDFYPSSQTWNAAAAPIGSADPLFPVYISFDRNRKGDYIIAWIIDDVGVNSDVWAMVDINGNITGLQKIDNEDLGQALSPMARMDENGNAIVVWTAYNETIYNAWYNRFEPAAKWSTADTIETVDSSSTNNLKLTMDSEGNALATWVQSDGSQNNMHANYFSTATGWKDALIVNNDAVGNSSQYNIANDTMGNFTVIWKHIVDSQITNFAYNRYIPAAGWYKESDAITERLIAPPEILPPEQMADLVSDGFGKLTLIWRQKDTVRDNIWSIRWQ